MKKMIKENRHYGLWRTVAVGEELEGSNVGYKDLPVLYIPHKDAKETILAVLGAFSLIFGICLGIEVYWILYGTHIHPRPLFGFMSAFGFIIGMVELIKKIEIRWNLRDKDEDQN